MPPAFRQRRLFQDQGNVMPFTGRGARRRAPAWRRRGAHRHMVLLGGLWIAMATAIYVQGYGVHFPRSWNSADAAVDDTWRTSIPICGIGRLTTCLVDGDTGWEDGRKWRLLSIDTPELSSPACRAEYNTALLARDRLASLMSEGYRIIWSGRTDKYDRALVDVELFNGTSAAQVLLDEGLAQKWPNVGNVWCGR